MVFVFGHCQKWLHPFNLLNLSMFESRHRMKPTILNFVLLGRYGKSIVHGAPKEIAGVGAICMQSHYS